MTFGSIVELELNKPSDKWKALPGARAKIVDGKKIFPELHDQLEEYLRNFGSQEKDLEEFIWVVWDRSDLRWNRQDDGAYAKYRFKLIPAQEPKNNDGREECFWCGGKTDTRQGFSSTWNICPKCKK